MPALYLCKVTFTSIAGGRSKSLLSAHSMRAFNPRLKSICRHFRKSFAHADCSPAACRHGTARPPQDTFARKLILWTCNAVCQYKQILVRQAKVTDGLSEHFDTYMTNLVTNVTIINLVCKMTNVAIVDAVPVYRGRIGC